LSPQEGGVESGERSVDLREMYRRVLAIISKRKWIFALALAVAVGVGATYIATAPKVYEARASIIIYANTPQVLGGQFRDVVDVEMGSWWSAREYIQTQYDELRSESLAADVALALEKKGKLELLGVGAGPQGRAFAVPVIRGALSVEPVKESRTVVLAVRYRDPDTAAELANTIAETFKDKNLERRLGRTRENNVWLSEQLGSAKTHLEKSEMDLYEFKRREGVISVSLQDSANILSNQLKKLNEAATDAKTKRIQLAARKKVLNELRTNDPVYDPKPEIGESKSTDSVGHLKEMFLEQNAKLLELKGKYLDEHPTVIAQKARVEAIRAELRRESELALKTVEADYSLALETEKSLTAALEQVKEEAIAVNKKEIEYDRLRRQAENDAKLYDMLLGRLKESGLAGQLQTNNVRLLDSANTPHRPVSPNVPLAITLSIVLGLAAGFGLALLLDFIDNTVKSHDDIERLVGVPFLGLIPQIAGKGNGATTDASPLYIFEKPKSAVAECCRAIRTNILFMSPDRPLRSILVTSSGPMEGKSTTSINLAVTMALSGNRVLLLDTDLRRPRLHRAFGVAAEHGMSTLILGESRFEDVIKSTSIPNLWVIPCGPLPPNPAELMHAQRFREVIKELAERYDRLIFDSPPLNVVTDAAVLSALVDGTVLVARCERTTRDMLQRARRQLSDVNANVLGCVLNEVNLMQGDARSSYYYYQRYGYYYGSYGDDKSDQPASTN
jgi:capsular exopolysaccharide synthesis family protein